MRLPLLTAILFVAAYSFAQDQIGIANSNYAGTDAVGLAPGRAVYQWQFTDIRLVGFEANVWNNYAFITSRQQSAFGEVRSGIRGDGGELTFLNTLSDRKKKGSVFTEVQGPAFLMGMGRNAFGMHVTSKAQFTVSNVSPELAAFMWNGLDYEPQQGVRYHDKNVRVTSNAYTEIGGTFSRQLLAEGKSLFSAGATVKYLKGHFAGGFLLQDLDYEVHDSTSMTVYNADGEFGYVEPGFNAGSGMGFDVGIHYQKTLEDVGSYVPHSVPYGCEPMPYRFRFSLSLLDIGSIRYRNATAGYFNNASAYIPDYNDLTLDSPADVDSMIGSDFDGVLESSEIRMGLASAIAADFDLRLAENFFVGANMVQPFGGTSQMRIRRNAFFAVTPRFEMERVELAAPVILREYQRAVVGLMLRLNSVVIGSDDIIPWFSKSADIYSADIYAKLKITLFRKGACKNRKPKAKADIAANDERSMPCVLPE